MTPLVSLIIPNYNGGDRLKKNLSHLVNLKGIQEIILADDCSADDSVQWVNKKYPQIRVISGVSNAGFPANVNRAVASARGQYVAIINHDLTPHPNAIIKVLPHFKDPDVAGVTFFETGDPRPGVGVWQNGWLETPHSRGQPSSVCQSFWGSGGETIYRKDAWDQLGGYDEIFSPGYWEDIDFGYRLRKRGWKILWDPGAIINSGPRGESFGQRFDDQLLVRLKERNRLLLIWKNVISRSMMLAHLVALTKRTIVHPGYFKVIICALKYLPQIRLKRSVERKEGIISDEEVFQRFHY